MNCDLSDIYTHSVKIEDTSKGIRIHVHCRATHGQTASQEAIKLYLETKKLAEKKKIQLAPFEIAKEKMKIE